MTGEACTEKPTPHEREGDRMMMELERVMEDEDTDGLELVINEQREEWEIIQSARQKAQTRNFYPIIADRRSTRIQNKYANTGEDKASDSEMEDFTPGCGSTEDRCAGVPGARMDGSLPGKAEGTTA
ncbi:unnamed protein product [Urochloa humidicola]